MACVAEMVVVGAEVVGGKSFHGSDVFSVPAPTSSSFSPLPHPPPSCLLPPLVLWCCVCCWSEIVLKLCGVEICMVLNLCGVEVK